MCPKLQGWEGMLRNGDEREFINTYINRAINKTRERLWMGSDVSVKKQGVPDLAILQRTQ